MQLLHLERANPQNMMLPAVLHMDSMARPRFRGLGSLSAPNLHASVFSQHYPNPAALQKKSKKALQVLIHSEAWYSAYEGQV